MTERDWSAMLVARDAPLTEVAMVVRFGGGGAAFAADAERRLLGAITDGDIRRALLRGLDMNAPAEQAMNPNPRSAPEAQERRRYFAAMRAHAIFQLPILDGGGRVVDVALLSETARAADRPNRVVLMAGGLGSRLRPLTNTVPKPMLSVGGRPLLQRIVEQFIDAGFRRFLISVNYLAEKIEAHFLDGGPLGVDIDYLRETKRLGTAGCLSLLPERPQEPIFVMNGDILTDIDFAAMLRFHEDTGAVATMALNTYRTEVPYGVVELDGHRIAGVREKPELSFFVNAGVYVLSPEALDRVPDDAFLDMPTLFDGLREEGAVVSGFPLHEYWIDIGRPTDLERANEVAAGRAADAPSP